MKRPIALLAAALSLTLGLIAAQPSAAQPASTTVRM